MSSWSDCWPILHGSIARFAMEHGYHVTLVLDAKAAFRHEMMHAAHELTGPTSVTPVGRPLAP
jgi:hypothetical protein